MFLLSFLLCAMSFELWATSNPCLLAAHGSSLLYPCLCLCFEFSQITRTTPLRWMTLHLSQIFFTDARTFMIQPSAIRRQPSGKPDQHWVRLIYNDKQFVRDSNRKARARPQLCRPAECE